MRILHSLFYGRRIPQIPPLLRTVYILTLPFPPTWPTWPTYAFN